MFNHVLLNDNKIEGRKSIIFANVSSTNEAFSLRITFCAVLAAVLRLSKKFPSISIFLLYFRL